MDSTLFILIVLLVVSGSCFILYHPGLEASRARAHSDPQEVMERRRRIRVVSSRGPIHHRALPRHEKMRDWR